MRTLKARVDLICGLALLLSVHEAAATMLGDVTVVTSSLFCSTCSRITDINRDGWLSAADLVAVIDKPPCTPMDLGSFSSAPAHSWDGLLAHARSLGYLNTLNAVSCAGTYVGERVVIASLGNPTAADGGSTLGLIYSEPGGVSSLVFRDAQGGITLFDASGGVRISATGSAEPVTSHGQVAEASGRLKRTGTTGASACDPYGECNFKLACIINDVAYLAGFMAACGTAVLTCATPGLPACLAAAAACEAFILEQFTVLNLAISVPCAVNWFCPDGNLCGDGNACTQNNCHFGRCIPNLIAPALLTGTPCDDGDACTAPDACFVGACRAGADVCVTPAPTPTETPTERPTAAPTPVTPTPTVTPTGTPTSTQTCEPLSGVYSFPVSDVKDVWAFGGNPNRLTARWNKYYMADPGYYASPSLPYVGTGTFCSFQLEWVEPSEAWNPDTGQHGVRLAKGKGNPVNGCIFFDTSACIAAADGTLERCIDYSYQACPDFTVPPP